MSETSKYRELTVIYCQGNGLDIGSQGDPVVPCAVSIDLPKSEFAYYSSGADEGKLHWRGHGEDLPFKDNSCDFVYSSHLLEDFPEHATGGRPSWRQVTAEWMRVCKPGGRVIILVPDRDLWASAINRGQPPNCEHRHEFKPGELTKQFREFGWEIIRDDLTNLFENDYSILFVAKKQ